MTIDAGLCAPSRYTSMMIVDPWGRWRCSQVLKGREMTVQQAIDGLAAGQIVWVAPSDMAEVERRWQEVRLL